MKRRLTYVGVVICIIGGIWFWLSISGRSASRIGGKTFRQTLEIDNMKETVGGISFDKRGASTVKDVTFIATDNYIYTQEFIDASIAEGIIRWVPYGEGGSWIRTRAISRWFGGVVDLELPEDCSKVEGVDVGYSSTGERVKNLTYKSKDGKTLSKEYREGLLDRTMEGWLEVKAGK